MGKIVSEYSCSLILANDLLGGKWKQRILWHIIHGDNRFSLLKKAIPDVTHKMLISELRELESSGLILRKDYGQLPLKVEYSLSEKYTTLIPILDSLCNFVDEYAKENGILIQKNIESEAE